MHTGIVVLHAAGIKGIQRSFWTAMPRAKGVCSGRRYFAPSLILRRFRLGLVRRAHHYARSRADRLILLARVPGYACVTAQPNAVTLIDIELIVKCLVLHKRQEQY